MRLNGDIQSGGGFIGHQERRAGGQGHSDHGALLQATAEFMRVSPLLTLGILKAHQAQQAEHLRARRARALVKTQRLGDLRADAPDGIESHAGLLKYIGYASSAQMAQRRRRHRQHFPTPKADAPAADDPGWRGHQAR